MKRRFLRFGSVVLASALSIMVLSGSISKEIGELQDEQIRLLNEISYQDSVIEEQANAYAELSLIHEEMTAEIVELQVALEELEKENEELKKAMH